MHCPAEDWSVPAPSPFNIPDSLGSENDRELLWAEGAHGLRAPPEHTLGDQAGATLPAIVFSFGGGWRNGTPAQFVEQYKCLASRGMVAITADYRVKSRQNVTPLECIADAKSAIRWVRRNANDLGIDANRIAAGGGSAGGRLAAALATVNDFDDKSDDVKISAVADALVLFNPALGVANIPVDYGFGDKAAAAPHLQHVKAKLPPAGA